MTCFGTLLEPESVRRGGCLQTKGAVYVAPEKSCVVLDWIFRDQSGQPVDLEECFGLSDSSISLSDSLSLDPPPVVFRARFMLPDEPGLIYESFPEVREPALGRLRVPVPFAVLDQPAIWSVQVALLHSTQNRILRLDRGLLSVERNSWGDFQLQQGPLTLEQIRIFLRDSPRENDLLLEYEFDAVEILQAMLRPIRQWNETPPDVGRFTTRNFPWVQHWLEATVGWLLETAGHWYLRNKHSTVAAGLQLQDREKDGAYFQLANLYHERWRMFMLHQKTALNIQLGMSKIPSPHQVFRGW